MTSKKLTAVKDRINKFAKDHPIAYTTLIRGVEMTALMGVVYLMARHNAKVFESDEIAKTTILQNTSDEYCAIKDDFMIDLDPKSIADTIGRIKNEGFAITKEGLDALHAVIDNPVIID